MKKLDPKNLPKLNKKRLEYYKFYAEEYYNSSFRENQGTEEILQLLSSYKDGGKWLDVGSGTCTLFWAMALDRITDITCSDMYPEAHKILIDYLEKKGVPKCYTEASKILGLNIKNSQKYKKLISNFVLFDALKKWPVRLKKEQYDIITCFGVFGLSKTVEEYIKCFSYFKNVLSKKAIIIGANWKRSKFFVKTNGGSNSYLSTKLIKEAAFRYKYEIVFLKEKQIIGDPNYDSVIIWALRQRT